MGILFEIKEPHDNVLSFMIIFGTLFFLGLISAIELIPMWVFYGWVAGVLTLYQLSKLRITPKN